jgi:molecular chaperone GrpE
MNQDKALETANDHSDNPLSSASVDEFIRELEHMEQDLHITSELQIEVSESEFDDTNLPDFILEELKPARPEQGQAQSQSSPAAQEMLRREIAQLQGVVAKFKDERKKLLERTERLTKDFDNFKSRTERERHESISIQMVNLAARMLPVLDNLNRAMDFVSAMGSEQRSGIEPFIDGISLVHSQVDEVLSTMGVQPIVAVGKEFDPHFHEAVAIEQSTELPPNTVSGELLRGYQMGTRVLRHSMVKVVGAPDYNNVPSTGETSGNGGDLAN